MPAPTPDTPPTPRPIRLLCGRTPSARDHEAAGICRHALSQDPRVQWVHTGGAEQHLPGTQWTQGLQALAAGELEALVWMAEDLALHDFLLVDRVQEWRAAGLQSLSASHEGREVLRVQVAAPMADTGTALDGVSPTVHDARRFLTMSVQGQPLRAPAKDAATTVPPLLLVTASRAAPQDFYTHTALGRSVQRLRAAGVALKVRAACHNREPLAKVYNAAMEPGFADHTVVFVHDDVVIEDHHIAPRLHDALQHFDLVGLAGCVQRLPGQPAWLFPQRVGRWAPRGQLLGCVGHDTTGTPGAVRRLRKVNHFGATRQRAALLDGVLLAVRGQMLQDAALRFDPALAFDFYDLDFCRQAEQRGLRAGVWPLAITHLSAGNFDSPSWRRTYPIYLEKWGEKPPEHTP